MLRRADADRLNHKRGEKAMFFRDDSCISENTIDRYYNDYRLHQLMGSDWFGIMSLSSSGHVRIDNCCDASGVGDEYALEFVKAHTEELQVQDYVYRLYEYEDAYFLIYPIRVNEHGYMIFFLHCRLTEPFEEKDVAWYCLFSDISYKRLLLNNELLQQKDYIGRVLESTQDIITVLDPDCNVLEANQAAGDLLAGAQNLVRLDGLLPAGKELLAGAVREAVATNSKQYLNNVVAEYQGRKHILEMTISPLSNSKGVPSGVVVVGTDITTKQMSEYEFEQFKHYATLGEISLGLSHDVKNPLMNIRSCVTLLKRGGGLGENGGELLDTIVGEVKRIDDTIQQMLSFGKVGKQNGCTLVNINEVLEDCVQILHRQRAYRRITVRYMPGKPVPLIRAKNSDMQQIFINIMLNALQSIEDKGHIDISSFYDRGNNQIHVAVSDDGCGIAKEDMALLFNPYYSTKPNGTGLGLFLVKRIVEQYHGTIRIESMQWDGTICTVTLPCA